MAREAGMMAPLAGQGGARRFAGAWLAASSLLFAVPGQAQNSDAPPDTAGNRPQPDYDPAGLRAGNLTLYPQLGLDTTADSNVLGRDSNAQADMALVVVPTVRANYAAGRIRFDAESSARLRRYADLTGQNDEQYHAALRASLAPTQASQIAPAIDWSRSTVGRGTFENGLQVGDPLQVDTLSTQITYTQRINRLSWRSTGRFVRSDFADVRLDDGTIIDQDFRDIRSLGGSLAMLYDVADRLSILATGDFNRYRFAEPDPARDRDAQAHALGIGLSYNFSDLLTAEVAVGQRKHSFRNPLLADFSGLSVSGRLRWYPTRLVSVSFDLTQAVSTSSFDSVSAVTVTSTSIRTDYELRRNVMIVGTAQFDYEKYSGLNAIGRRLSLGGEARWRIARWLAISGRLSLETRTASRSAILPSYSAVRSTVGVTFYR